MERMSAYCAAVGLLLATGTASALTLTPGNVEIVVSPVVRGKTNSVRYAAEEMTNFLTRAFGTGVRVVTEFDPDRTQVVLGSNDWSVAAGIDTAKLPRDGFALKTKGNALYIAGVDDAPQRATLFGVYEFLERYVGCRFYFPGELGEIVPEKKSVSVPDLDETCAPAWTERSISSHPGSWFDPKLNAQEEYRKERYRLRLETRRLPCCHGQYASKLVPRFGKTHPEYFCMNAKGERVIVDTEAKPHYRNAQLCYTSAVWEEICQDALSYFRGEGPEVRGMIVGKAPNHKPGWGPQASHRIYYDIMPHDGMRCCVCPTCTETFAKAKDQVDYATETVWGWTAKIAQRIKDAGLKGSVSQMAYHPYKKVPDFALPDNIVVSVCNNGGWARGARGEEDIALVKAWFEKVGKVKLFNNTGKFSCWKMNIPDVPSTAPYAISAFYNRVSPMIRGAYFDGTADRFLYTAMNSYCFSRIAWYGQADIPAIMDEHYQLMYGAAAEPMKAFFDLIERLWMDKFIGESFETTLGAAIRAPSEFRVWTEIYSQEAQKPLARLMARAEAAVPADSLEGRRVALIRREYLDPMATRAANYVAGLSVEKEKVRRAKNPPKSLVVGFKPMTITVASGETNTPIKAVKFAADLKPGGRYRISYFIRGEGLAPNVKRGGAGAAVSAGKEFACPNGPLDGTFDWVHQSGDFCIPEHVAKDFKPEVCLRILNATGTAHFSGLVIEEIGK